MEADIRGMRAEEVYAELDRYLNDAYLSNLPFVRIVHGKGTGVLRQVVRDILRSHPLIASFRLGEAGEGGDGVTVATLKNN
jgi:DNA mismatch repair protein MutS2